MNYRQSIQNQRTIKKFIIMNDQFLWDEEETYYSSSDELHSFPEPYNLSYEDNSSFQLPDLIDAVDQYNQEHSTDTLQVSDESNDIAYSESIPQTRSYISSHFNCDYSNLHRDHIPGLLILRLEDFCLLRQPPNSRIIPHLIIGPPDQEFCDNHLDFQSCFNALYSK